METFNQFKGQFNNTFNGLLEPIFANQYAALFIIIGLVMYTSYYAPRVPIKAAILTMNSWFRFGVLVLMALMFKVEPSVAIMIGVAWYVTQTYVLKNSYDYVQQSGQITDDYVRMIAGTSFPGLKDAIQINAEGQLIKSEMQTKTAPGQLQNVPQAVLSSTGGATTIQNASIDTVPSGTPANAQTMMEQAHPMSKGPGGLLNNSPGGKVPAAYVPAEIMSIAAAPVA